MDNEVTTKAALVMVDDQIEFLTPSAGDTLTPHEEQVIHFMEGVYLMLKNDSSFQHQMILYAQSCPVSAHELHNVSTQKH